MAISSGSYMFSTWSQFQTHWMQELFVWLFLLNVSFMSNGASLSLEILFMPSLDEHMPYKCNKLEVNVTKADLVKISKSVFKFSLAYYRLKELLIDFVFWKLLNIYTYCFDLYGSQSMTHSIFTILNDFMRCHLVVIRDVIL